MNILYRERRVGGSCRYNITSHKGVGRSAGKLIIPLMTVPRLRMVKLLVMLAQEIFTVIVAIRRRHHRVDVIARRFLVAQRDTALMIELDEDDRAVDSIIKHAMLVNNPIEAI